MANLKISLRKKGSSDFEGGDKLLPETDWAYILNKPPTFVPDPHEHPIEEIAGLQSALNAKLNLAGGTMTGAITMGSNNITGNNSSIFQAGRIIATNSSTLNHGITSKGSRANMLYLMDGVTGGLAASLLDVDVKNTTTPQERIAKIGIYGGATSGPGGIPSATYLWLSSVKGNAHDTNATLKVDSQNRVGIALSGTTRPSQALDVGDKIRMRTETVDADGTDIVVTKGYMLSKIPSVPSIPSVMPVQEGIDGTYTDVRTINSLNLRQIVEGLSPPGSRPASDVKDWAKSSQTVAENRFLTVNNNAASWRTAPQMRSDLGLGTLATSNGLALNDLTDATYDGTPIGGQALVYGAGAWYNATLGTADISGLQSALNGKVNMSGAETISGLKTFNNGIVIPGQNNYIDIGNKTNWFWTRFSGENWTFNNTFTGGGWARNLMEMKDATEPTANTYFRIGAQGSGQNFTQMYIGPAYNNYWLSLNGTRALFGTKPQYAGDPTNSNDLTRKSYVDNKSNGKFDTPTGTTSQYVRGNGSLATFPSVMQIQEGTDGTDTTARTINASNLRGIIEDYIDNAGKQNTITGAASTITTSDLATNMALISSSTGKVTTSTIQASQLLHLNGVTSGIQTQLNGKANDNEVVKLTTSGATIQEIASRIDISNTSIPFYSTRKTTANGGIYAAAMFTREITTGTPANNNGPGIYFRASSSTREITHAGIFGGRLAVATQGASVGEIVLGPAWNGADPYQRADFRVRARSASIADAYINGKFYSENNKEVATQEWVTANTRSSSWTPTWGQVTSKPENLIGQVSFSDGVLVVEVV